MSLVVRGLQRELSCRLGLCYETRTDDLDRLWVEDNRGERSWGVCVVVIDDYLLYVSTVGMTSHVTTHDLRRPDVDPVWVVLGELETQHEVLKREYHRFYEHL